MNRMLSSRATMSRRSVPEVKSTLIKSRCGNDSPPRTPDDTSVIDNREESYGCTGRTESKEIERLAQPPNPQQQQTANSISIVRPATTAVLCFPGIVINVG